MGAFLKKWAQKIFGVNWRTTVAGCTFGGALALLEAMQNGVTLRGALLSAGIAIIAILAKDAGVSGTAR